mgnify:CR=1 FL=1
MKVELLSITPECEKLIEIAGRECYQSIVGNPKIIQNWIKSGHESVIEHACATFKISDVSRAESHQHVRHRIASYSQKSQRWVMEDYFNFITPKSIKNNPDALELYTSLMDTIRDTYHKLIKLGIKKEDARFTLPNACATSFVCTMNFRSMRNFFKLRLDSHAQWEILEVANEMLKLVKPLAPNVFFDIEVIDEINS